MLEDVIKNDYCLGCGGCQILNQVNTVEDEFGRYLPNITKLNNLDQDVCPISGDTENELQISKSLFAHQINSKFEKNIGYYQNIYAGYVCDEKVREKGTSGGLTKWFLCKLLQTKEVDGVIHVTRKNKNNQLFEYDISRTINDVKNASEAAYYTTNFSEVISKIAKEKDGKSYVFVGVPCYCKSLVLLKKKYPQIARKIKFIVGIFCGHMKTKNYAKLMAWESKLNPNELEYVNFRKKQPDDNDATDYNFHAKTNTEEKIIKRKLLSGGNYNIPHLKYKACDYCEDVFGYCTDIIFGDAWLEEFRKDNKGTNVLLIRSEKTLDMFKKFKYELCLKKISISQLIESQRSSYSHRLEKLCYRLYLNEQNNEWYPKRTVSPKLIFSKKDRDIQKIRIKIRDKSHYLFLQALTKNDLGLYFKEINIYIEKLNAYYKISKPRKFFNNLIKFLRRLLKILIFSFKS